MAGKSNTKMVEPARQTSQRQSQIAVDLTAVLVAVSGDEPRALTIRRPGGLALPSGPLQLRHRTLDAGLRAWVGEQTGAKLGYVEQLYTFGDHDRAEGEGAPARVLSIGYLALTRETAAPTGASWQGWYRHMPWEDWRRGRPAMLDRLERALRRWAGAGVSRSEKAARRDRVAVAFGLDGVAWSDERALERYELLYEVGLVAEAHRDGATTWSSPGDVPPESEPMLSDHRRILATAIARLRGKIKYRPVVFELMPPGFTLLQLQRAVEALSGVRLHKQNFRRLVEQQGLVEETGRTVTGTGGRPAREVRFREDVILERHAPGVRLPISRDSE
jgi:hypothetical protein